MGKPGKGAELESRRLAFAREYAHLGSAKGAAMAVGISAASAPRTASRWLKRPEVVKIVKDIQRQAAERSAITIAKVVKELAGILLADPAECVGEDGKILPLKQWPKPLRCALSGLDIKEWRDQYGIPKGEVLKFKFWSKTEAARQLMQHLGGFAADNAQQGLALSDLIEAATGGDK